MQANTFNVIERRKRVIFFKLGKLWVFKQFFDNHEHFNALLDYYNKDLYRFEFKSIGARNNALKLLERNGFDYDLVEDLKGYVVQLPKSAKYAQILKNSVAFKEAANERLFLMKDLVAVEEAVGLGAKIYDGDISF
jgi:DNA integrity scanning protein DisA with diadenylate cyclase activity